ncbi:MAG: hypothetical protein AAFU64_16630 [Bacteroidota bacterium]
MSFLVVIAMRDEAAISVWKESGAGMPEPTFTRAEMTLPFRARHDRSGEFRQSRCLTDFFHLPPQSYRSLSFQTVFF